MGRLRRRLQALREKSAYQRTTLVCPECGEEFTAYGDVALQVIVYQWSSQVPADAHTWRETPEDVLRLFEHPHDVGAFVDKASGLPFLSKAAGGFGFVDLPERDL